MHKKILFGLILCLLNINYACADEPRFQNQVIFITGGTSGIGLATAVQFAANGAAHVIVCGRISSKWNKAQEYMKLHLTPDQTKVIEYWPCDVRLESSIKETIDKIYTQYGRLDVAFNNAGVSPGKGKEAGDIDKAQFESRLLPDGSIAYIVPAPQPASNKTINTNWKTSDPTESTDTSPYRENPIATTVFGVLYSMKWEIADAFAKQPKNLPLAIINTASRNGIIPDPSRPLYAASKAFIINLTKSLSSQVAQRAIKEHRAMIRINVIAPGPVDTPMERASFPGPEKEYIDKAKAGVPMQRIAQPEEIAPSVLFLADDKMASYITGAVLPIDGGDTASPYIPD